jgi:hypothetical protein
MRQTMWDGMTYPPPPPPPSWDDTVQTKVPWWRGGKWLSYTVNSAKRTQGQRTCAQLKSVHGAYYSLNMLTDTAYTTIITISLAGQSIICTVHWNYNVLEVILPNIEPLFLKKPFLSLKFKTVSRRNWTYYPLISLKFISSLHYWAFIFQILKLTR